MKSYLEERIKYYDEEYRPDKPIKSKSVGYKTTNYDLARIEKQFKFVSK